jgi:hypothetical protein
VTRVNRLICVQIITATEAHPSNHSSHSRGVYAILETERSPLGVLQVSRCFRMSNPLSIKMTRKVCVHIPQGHTVSYVIYLQTPGLLHPPALPPSIQGLDALLIRSWPLICLANDLISSSSTLVEDLQQTLNELRLFNVEFSNWATSQPDEWKPRTICSINREHGTSPPSLSWFSGRIDVYLDRKYCTLLRHSVHRLTIQFMFARYGMCIERTNSLSSTA